ncbi:hypothetical protein AKO1_003898 [Acrasis kona]|uniref:Uncharacterized protein n=1 Tax=Acrasis kona TaxID=1008807 RepID=A0AAW2ZJI3_9EUKA
MIDSSVQCEPFQSELKLQNEQLMEKIDESEHKMRTLHLTIQELNQEKSSLQSECSLESTKCTQLQQDIHALQVTINQHANEHASLSIKYHQLKSDYNTSIEHNQSTLQNLQNTISDLTCQLSTIKQEQQRRPPSPPPSSPPPISTHDEEETLPSQQPSTTNTSEQQHHALNEKEKGYLDWKTKSLDKINSEREKLKRAKQFVKQEKQDIKFKQNMLERARNEWRSDIQHFHQNNGSHQSDRILMSVKSVLEKQAIRLNDDVKQLNRIQRWIVLRKEKLKLLQEKVLSGRNHHHGHHRHGGGRPFSSCSSHSSRSSPCSSTPSCTSTCDVFDTMSNDSSSAVSSMASPLSTMSSLLNHHHRHASGGSGGEERDYGDIGRILNNIESEIADIHEKIKNHMIVSSSSAPNSRNHFFGDELNAPDVIFTRPSTSASVGRQVTQSLNSSMMGSSRWGGNHRNSVSGDVLVDPVGAKWSKYFRQDDRVDSDRSLDRLYEFQKQLCRWGEERDVECEILTEHTKWLRTFHQELSAKR